MSVIVWALNLRSHCTICVCQCMMSRCHMPALMKAELLTMSFGGRLQLARLGTRVAVAMPDCRSERTRHQVLSLETHMNLIVKVQVGARHRCVCHKSLLDLQAFIVWRCSGSEMRLTSSVCGRLCIWAH